VAGGTGVGVDGYQLVEIRDPQQPANQGLWGGQAQPAPATMACRWIWRNVFNAEESHIGTSDTSITMRARNKAAPAAPSRSV
jgi:hypothetical protein